MYFGAGASPRNDFKPSFRNCLRSLEMQAVLMQRGMFKRGWSVFARGAQTMARARQGPEGYKRLRPTSPAE